MKKKMRFVEEIANDLEEIANEIIKLEKKFKNNKARKYYALGKFVYEKMVRK